MGRHFTCLYPDEDIRNGKPTQQLKWAIEQGRFEEGQRVREDGSRFWADVVITPVLDSACQMQGFSKVTRDITKRKQAEENLRALLGRNMPIGRSS